MQLHQPNNKASHQNEDDLVEQQQQQQQQQEVQVQQQPDHILKRLYRVKTEHPNHVLFRWLDKNGKETRTISSKQLWEKSQAVASALKKKNIHKGDRVMIVYPVGLDFLRGVFGCMLVGAVPCIVNPPNPQKKTEMEEFKQVVLDANARHGLTTFKQMMEIRSPQSNTTAKLLEWIATDDMHTNKDGSDTMEEIDLLDIAYVQYFISTTSGSTLFLKGSVNISHKTLNTNVKQSPAMSKLTSRKRSTFISFSWMPQYHDFGLLGFFMATIYSGSTGVCCSPFDFISNPILWHNLIMKYEADVTLGSNFSYGMLIKTIHDKKKQQPVETWDTVKVAMCAAEPLDRHNAMEGVKRVLGVKTCKLWVGPSWRLSLKKLKDDST